MKSKRKSPPPQFELPQAEEIFNLASPETATDGERLRRETEARAAAKLKQEQQQPTLL